MTLHHGDCVEVMATLPEASVDAVCTDPPYGLEFMGKEWDRLGAGFARGGSERFANSPPLPTFGRTSSGTMQQWHQRWATEALRVAKPGAYLLAFGGTRTYHRLACAIEDAGWIIRDCLVWAYASGFPKSRALLKPAWEPIVMARKPGPLRELAIDATRLAAASAEEPRPMLRDASGSSGAYSTGSNGLWHKGDRTARNLGKGLRAWSDARPGLDSGLLASGLADGFAGHAGQDSPAGYQSCPRCDGALAQIAEVVAQEPAPLRHDVPFFPQPLEWLASRIRESRCADHPSIWDELVRGFEETGVSPSGNDTAPSLGRWPANVILTSPIFDGDVDGVVGGGEADRSPNAKPPQRKKGTRRLDRVYSGGKYRTTDYEDREYGDTGTYSRFFLIPKADRAEREPSTAFQAPAGALSGSPDRASLSEPAASGRRNHHPTVKPLDLMRHLVRLITPPAGTVLDPFLGSGTTAIAAEMEGFAWIGIEREAEYVAIAEARLQGVQRGLGLSA